MHPDLRLYEREFDALISLGSTCLTRYQLSATRYRRRAGADPDRYHLGIAQQEESHFFDWLISPPY